MTYQPLSVDEIVHKLVVQIGSAVLAYQTATIPNTMTNASASIKDVESYAKATLNRLLLQEQINLLEYFDQVPDNNAIDWKSLFADTRKLLQAALTKEEG